MTIVESAARTAVPIIRTDGKAIVVDLSIGAKLCGEAVAGLGSERLGQLIDATMAEAGTGFAFGRYAEPRGLYLSDAFAGESDAEQRTIHMGIDLFCVAGTEVYAPLSGSVELLANNAREQDYGPLVVLRHADKQGRDFFILFGHLGEDVFDRLETGQHVSAGQRIASVGAPPQNGNWPPHLHAQTILDLRGLGADFPGVADRSRQDYWLDLSPSPAAFFPECARHELEYS